MFGLDLHPAVVHFPIALAVTGSFAEVGYWVVRRPWVKWFGPVLLTLALAGSGAAYFSGQAVHDKVLEQGVPREAIDQHLNSCLWALGALGLATLLSWAVRPRGKGLWLSALVALTAAALTLYTGYLGAELVYVHGAGQVRAPHSSTSGGVR